MTQHYTHINQETARNAVAMLPEIGTRANAVPATAAAYSAELEGILAKLEGLGRAELEQVGERVREMLGR